MPTVTGVSHVELSVSDAARSAEWYQRVLGLQPLTPLARPDWGPGLVVTLLHPTAFFGIGLLQHEPCEQGRFSEFRLGLDHLAFAVESRAELEAWVAHLDACGVEHSAIDDASYASVVVFRDPDNIQLELFFMTSPTA
jgi:catechol 2,3-dioxygenase-like lactoylglutathione lyase family enzyme